MPQVYVQAPRPNKVILMILISLVSFFAGWQLTDSGILGADGSESVYQDSNVAGVVRKDKADLSLFWTVWGELEEKYFANEILNDEKMVYGAIKGLVDSLDDPYTVFMTPEESKQFTEGIEGILEGIGAELIVEEKNLVIVSALRGSPAEKAGLLSGDIIYKIENELATDMTLVEAIMKIRGKKGTTVNLTMLREKVDEPFEVSIVRDSIDIESVTVEKLDGNIVYLGVNYFNAKTNDEFRKAVSELLLNEPKGLIVDLRFNGGGYLDIAVELLSYLLPSKTKVVTITERGKDEEIKYTNGNPKLLNVPLVVLVNESSASASEIVAGAIQDLKRGIIMGTKTYGKGTVQEVEFFSDDSSLRMTIAKWFTPNNRSVDKNGLDPDIVVEVQKEDYDKKYDRQKEEARKYLKGL